MKPDNDDLATMRELILKSQSELLDDDELKQLNRIAGSAEGGAEAASLIDQICAFSDSSSLDSPSIAKELLEAISDRSDDQNDNQRDIATFKLRSSEPASVSSTEPRQSSTFQWLLAVVASNILIGSLAWSFARGLPNQRSTGQTNFAEARSTSTSAELVSMTACVWRESGQLTPALGAVIEDGESLDLVEGIAEIRTGEGTPGEALLRIEGPAGVRMLADGQLDLQHGSLTADSLGTGSGIVVMNTPIGRVSIDGQSSVGVTANGSVTEVHLFSGRAIVEPTQSPSTMSDIRLEAGEAVRFSSQSENDVRIVMFEASMSSFVSARSSAFDPLNLGAQYVDAVMESKPSIYWRFEELGGEFPFVVANQGSVPKMDAVLVGNPGWRQYGENQVAEFGTSAEATAIRATEPWPPKPLDEYTIELWVKPQLFHHGEIICLHQTKALEDGRYQHTMMLEATAQHYFSHRLSDSAPNRFRFVHRELGSPKPISATNLFADQPYEARVWQHVAAQLKDNRQMLWVDGQLSAVRSNPVPLSQDVQILIGQVYPNSSYRPFVGQIDEVAIYDRCLSPQELRQHIRAAGRSPASKVE